MKKIRRSPVVTGLLFLLAVVLLFAGSVGGTQAALQVYSSDYISAFELDHIGITLYENGTPVSFRNYGDAAASGFTEKQSPCACLSPWYGSCPKITTFTSFRGVK